MSKNCIKCVTNARTGPDLLCDDCRDGLIVDAAAARQEWERKHGEERPGAEHTPGPWVLNDGMIYGTTAVQRVNVQIATVGVGSATTMEEDRANGRLVAAAPDLLAALKVVEQEIGGSFGHGDSSLRTDTVELIRAAIAGAEGRAH